MRLRTANEITVVPLLTRRVRAAAPIITDAELDALPGIIMNTVRTHRETLITAFWALEDRITRAFALALRGIGLGARTPITVLPTALRGLITLLRGRLRFSHLSAITNVFLLNHRRDLILE